MDLIFYSGLGYVLSVHIHARGREVSKKTACAYTHIYIVHICAHVDSRRLNKGGLQEVAKTENRHPLASSNPLLTMGVIRFLASISIFFL